MIDSCVRLLVLSIDSCVWPLISHWQLCEAVDQWLTAVWGHWSVSDSCVRPLISDWQPCKALSQWLTAVWGRWYIEAVWAECRRSACLHAPDVRTQPHCYGSFTGCVSRDESISGCVFWRTTVCVAQHRHTCLTACGQHQWSSLIDVFALLTPRHYKCRWLVRLPLATAPFRWLQCVHGTVCH